MATNNVVTCSYCLSKKVSRITSHHLYYSMCSKYPPPARTQCGTQHEFVVVNVQNTTSAFHKVV